MAWFRKSQSKKQKQADIRSAALESQTAMVEAASDTMQLAQDVTIGLQSKIEDYVSQIESTSKMLSDALLLVNSHGIIESFNPAAEKIFGWTKCQMIGKTYDALFKFEDTDVLTERYLDRFVADVMVEDLTLPVQYEDFRGICADGRLLYIDVSASKLTRSDGHTYYLILVRDVTKRVENEQQLAKLAYDNEQLLTAVNASETGIVITDPNRPDNPIIFANQGYCKMTGYDRKEVLGNNPRMMQGKGSKNEGYWILKKAISQGSPAKVELLNYRKDGSPFWTNVHITPVYQDDVLKYWIGIQYDITALKEAQDELRESEQHFRAFGEASSEAMLIHGDSKVLDWNPRLSEMTGYDSNEISQMKPQDFLHPLERESVLKIIAEEAAKHYETLFLTKGGDVMEVAINSHPVEWDNASARIAVIRDITHFKDIEVMLRSSRERYRTITDNTIDLVCCFNENFEITFANQTFRDYYEVEIEDLTGYSLLDVIPEEDHDAFVEYMKTITAADPVRRGIHRVCRVDEIRWQDWIDRAIFDDAGNLIEYQSVSRDITHFMK